MLALQHSTPGEYKDVVLSDVDAFLQDHASNERKVSQSALTLAVQYPNKAELCDAMVALAQEELEHFAAVYNLLKGRGKTLSVDLPDPYMGEFRRHIRKACANDYLLDRLLVFGIVEARGCERFSLVADALPHGELKNFYIELTRCEARHHALFLRLARLYFKTPMIKNRLAELLAIESAIVQKLPLRPALH